MKPKEQYFTEETIDEKSRDFFCELKEYQRKTNIKFEPARAALLIIDMQGYFISQESHAYIPGAASIVPGIKKLAESFSDRNLPVILTRHVNTDENADCMKTWWRHLITEDDPQSQIIPGLDMPDATVIKKTQYDAFYQTSLEEILLKNKVSQVVITGVTTHLCCETTARSAFIRGFTVFFPIDGTATYNEEFHRATLISLSHGFAVPVFIQDLVNQLNVSE